MNKAIGEEFNNKESAVYNDLWFEDRRIVVKPKQIKQTSRIGVNYVGSMWSKRKLRFHHIDLN